MILNMGNYAIHLLQTSSEYCTHFCGQLRFYQTMKLVLNMADIPDAIFNGGKSKALAA